MTISEAQVAKVIAAHRFDGYDEGTIEAAARLLETFAKRLAESMPPALAESMNCESYAKAIRELVKRPASGLDVQGITEELNRIADEDESWKDCVDSASKQGYELGLQHGKEARAEELNGMVETRPLIEMDGTNWYYDKVRDIVMIDGRKFEPAEDLPRQVAPACTCDPHVADMRRRYCAVHGKPERAPQPDLTVELHKAIAGWRWTAKEHYETDPASDAEETNWEAYQKCADDVDALLAKFVGKNEKEKER